MPNQTLPYKSQPYNLIRQKSSHNSFKMDHDFAMQVVNNKFFSQEYDIHSSRMAFEHQIQGDWYIYHQYPDLHTNCDKLSELLEKCKTYNIENKGHDVITIFLDTHRSAFSSRDNQSPQSLDNLRSEERRVGKECRL